MAESPEPPPQTPSIKTEQQSDGALKAKSDPNAQTKTGNDAAIGQEKPSPASEHKGQDQPKEATHEASEFWTIAGRSLKITDTLLVAFTFLLFLATLALFWATRDLVEDAKHSGEVNSSNMQAAIAESKRGAEAALKHSENTAERQLRAYVSEHTGTVHLRGNSLVVEIEIKNFGQTPAYDLSIVTQIGTYEAGKPFPWPSLPPGGDRSILGPGGIVVASTKLDVPVGNEGVIPILKAGGAIIYVCGQAKYRDAFGRRWTFDFKSRSLSFVDDKWIMGPTEEGNQETEDK